MTNLTKQTTSNQYDYLYLNSPNFNYQVKALPKPTPEALPEHLTLTIENNGESKMLYVHSRLHIKEVYQIGPYYSLEYTDDEIIKDLSEEIEQLFMFE